MANSKPLVAMLDFLSEATMEAKVLENVAHVEAWNLTLHQPLPEKAQEVEGILAWHLLHYDRALLQKFPKCKVLVRVGIGIDSVDLNDRARVWFGHRVGILDIVCDCAGVLVVIDARRTAGEMGIYVANVPDYGVEEVADSAINHLLNIMRHTVQASLQANQGDWKTEKAYGATRLRGRIFGIVGLGKIGKAIAVRAKAFGLDVVFYDPLLEDGIDKSLGVRRADSLKDLIGQCDILSLNCWLDEKNKHVINDETLGYITKPIYFVNVARGGLVDETALVKALKGTSSSSTILRLINGGKIVDGRIKGAGLDVTEKEPYPKDGPLLQFPNVLITPHSAFYSDQVISPLGFQEMREKAAREVKRVLEGGQPRNCVNLSHVQNPRNKRL